MAKKLSILRPRRLRNIYFFLSFSYHNFEEAVTNFEKDMFRKESCLANRIFKNVQFPAIFHRVANLQ